ncbi:ROK family protein [Streptomyces smyrnaeus]|uniref:ROK family protein n=1 Tax=Streptomyces smyrnaeus TaxID=1387713 RepID=UPI0036AFB8D7
MNGPTGFSLTDDALEEVTAWAAGREDRAVRLGIVLDAAAGLSVSESARGLGVSRPTVTAWRKRYAARGLAGLEHQPRSGRPARIDEADVMAATLAGPPAPRRTWSARSLADYLGLSHTALGRVWQRWQVRHGAATEPVALPLDPVLPCHRPMLLAAWAADDTGFVVLTDAEARARPHTKAATAEERQMRYAALTAVMRQVRADREDRPGATGRERHETGGRSPLNNSRPETPGIPIRTLPAWNAPQWAGRHLHVLTWGGVEGPTGLPDGAVRHAVPSSMGWAATVCLIAQLELRHQPQPARVALDSLAEAARAHAKTAPGTPFWWLRQERQVAAPRRDSVHRAFDQLALGSFNEKLVIESIRVAGSLSRVEIAERTGLTPQAVSRITRNLLTTRFLVADERRPTSQGMGKPRIPLRLRPDAACAIGIHIDPQLISLELVDLCGNVRAQRSFPVAEGSDPDPYLKWMTETAAQTISAVGPLGTKLLGVGVAAPGPLDVHEGVLLNPPLWAAWGEFPLRAELNRRLNVPVLLEKDATAAAIGERWLGTGETSTDFVYLYLGAGAGSGAFLNGDVFRGASGNAGEFGELTAYAVDHVTPEGGPRMVPECAPMSAVVEQARAGGLTGPDDGTLSYDAVCTAAAVGDPRAIRAVRNVARVVARGAVAMTDLYDTDLMVVGGPAVRPEVAELYLSETSEAVNRYPMARRVRPVRVTCSTLSASAAAVGAAAGVFHMIFAPRLRTHSSTTT